MTRGSAIPADAVAIVGMAGRFPGAPDIDTFWSNLLCGVDSISRFEARELEPSRLEEPGCRDRPDYVRARGLLAEAEMFDAAFFSTTPREAAVIDPQHRLLLETAWSALESAGYDPGEFAGRIGIWAGAGEPTYYHENVVPRPDVVAQIGFLQATMGSGKDYLTTRASYKLNLHGPSVSVYAGDATSLVAVCEAFTALLCRRCDLALAGGVSVTSPQRVGFVPGAGAHDGRCRPFDVRAAGPVPGHGVALVALKRLEEANADGDFVYAVIRGAASSNRGDCVGDAERSADAYGEVIAMAHALAGVAAESITYVEAHGAGTLSADEAEVAALKRVFAAAHPGSCTVGSVKGNIGDLGTAAGVAGLIKAALALRHRQIPPTLHFEKPNAELATEGCPFGVNSQPPDWTNAESPRRAGVSCFGSTNAHVVLEEAPEAVRSVAAHREQLLVLSAKTPAALESSCARLARQLERSPDHALSDIAHTLQVGRRAFPYRRALVCTSIADAVQGLVADEPGRAVSGHPEKGNARLAFLFPGQGAQAVGMAGELYSRHPVFAAELDACADVLEPLLDVDIRTLIFPPALHRDKAERRLAETSITQPALFAVELALARLWMSWGVRPTAMLGHSLGEYVAACLAGVMSRDQAATVVAMRGRLMQAQPRGTMMAVRLPVAELEPLLGPEVVIAAFNAPVLQVVSGPEAAIRELEGTLSGRGVGLRKLTTSHAFHSPMMGGALDPFREAMRAVSLQRPALPWISCVTGDWITPEQAVDPEYWVSQLRCPVRFSDGVRRLSQEPPSTLLEVGPGQTLTALVHLHRERPAGQVVAASLGKEPANDTRHILEALGRLWVSGLAVDWQACHGGARRARVPLPTYPFERNRHWIDPDPSSAAAAEEAEAAKPTADESAADHDPAARVRNPLRRLFADASGLRAEAIVGSQSFLELGFDSLLLTQVLAAIQRTFGVALSLRQLLEQHTTLDTLARHIQELAEQSAGAPSGEVRADSGARRNDPSGPPVPGARRGRDAQGNLAWFVPDPSRPGKYLQVKTNA